MTAKETIQKRLNGIAETQYFLRQKMFDSLKVININPAFRVNFGGKSNYYEYFVYSYGDRFFDMSTLIRLATEIENGLRNYYMEKRSHNNLTDLKNDPAYKKCKLGLFQRLSVTSRDDNVVSFFKSELNYNLQTNPFILNMQELMLIRHLYVHNSGILNEKFIDDYKKLMGVDISKLPVVVNEGFPQEDVCWFEPLKKLGDFIESSRKFFEELP